MKQNSIIIQAINIYLFIQIILDNELKELIKSLPERKRRTFLRYLNQKSKNIDNENPDGNKQVQSNNKEELLKKIAELKLNSNSDEDDDEDFIDDFGFDDEENSANEEDSDD